jgi:hypothetical protein
MWTLRPGEWHSPESRWSVEQWLVFFDERAGVAEFDAGLPRPQAEAHAFACCVAEWLNQHPAGSPPGRCMACGGRDCAHDVLLPYGIEGIGPAWVHSCCWAAWYADRKAQAAEALATIGVAAPMAVEAVGPVFQTRKGGQ